MALPNYLNGRVDPVLLRAMGFRQPGRFLCDTLPIAVPAVGAAFAGRIVTRPLANAFAQTSRISGDALVRQIGAEYPKSAPIAPDVSTPYQCYERAESVCIDQTKLDHWGMHSDEERAQEVGKVWDTIKAEHEYKIVNAIFDTSVYPNADITDLSVGVPITNQACDLYKLGRDVFNATRAATGQTPDYAVVSRDVALAMLAHPQTVNVTTLGDLSAGVAAQVTRDPPTMQQMLAMWAARWQVSAIYVQDVMALDGVSLVELSTGKIAFHTSAAIAGAYRNGNNLDTMLSQGAASLVMPRERPQDVLTSPEDDPIGERHVVRNSYGLVAPTNMVETAFIVTGALG